MVVVVHVLLITLMTLTVHVFIVATTDMREQNLYPMRWVNWEAPVGATAKTKMNVSSKWKMAKKFVGCVQLLPMTIRQNPDLCPSTMATLRLVPANVKLTTPMVSEQNIAAQYFFVHFLTQRHFYALLYFFLLAGAWVS